MDSGPARASLLILGGEACPEELGWRLAEQPRVWNTYGPTEATVVSHGGARSVPGEPTRSAGRSPAGSRRCVDEAGEPVALGEPGELVIGGVGLGRYLDPELDASASRAVRALGWERA